jgi:hypothetical protein
MHTFEYKFHDNAQRIYEATAYTPVIVGTVGVLAVHQGVDQQESRKITR